MIDRALMPGSNTPSPPACQIHSWLGCQRRTSSFQLIATAVGRFEARKVLRGLDGRRVARMPAREQRDAFVGRQRRQILDLADGGARRLLQEHMLAGLQRRARGAVAVLRRHAQRHRVELRDGGEHFLDGLEARDAVDAGVAAGGGDELVVGVRRPARAGAGRARSCRRRRCRFLWCCLLTWGSGRLEDWGASS